MDWVLDHSAVVYILLGAVALGFSTAFHRTGRALYLAYAAGMLALMPLWWLLSHALLTDRGQIERNIRRMAEAVVDGNADELFRYVADDFRFGTMDRDTLYAKVRQAITKHHVNDIRVFDFEVEKLSVAERQARVSFKAAVDSPDGMRLFLLRTEFVLREKLWKIRGMTMHNPLVNTDQPLGIP